MSKRKHLNLKISQKGRQLQVFKEKFKLKCFRYFTDYHSLDSTIVSAEEVSDTDKCFLIIYFPFLVFVGFDRIFEYLSQEDNEISVWGQ